MSVGLFVCLFEPKMFKYNNFLFRQRQFFLNGSQKQQQQWQINNDNISDTIKTNIYYFWGVYVVDLCYYPHTSTGLVISLMQTFNIQEIGNLRFKK